MSAISAIANAEAGSSVRTKLNRIMDRTQGDEPLDTYAETAYTIPTTTGTYTLDLANGMVQSVTLTGALTLTMPAAPAAGVTRSFVFEVDCAGSVLSWAASPAIQWVGGAAPTLETGAGSLNELTFRYSHLASAWVGRLTAAEAA